MYDFLIDALVPDAHITNMGMTDRRKMDVWKQDFL
jgi:hypothetical protein